MKKENYVDGLLYELINPEYEKDGRMISSEIHAQAKCWNPYSESSERMMNRICHHLNPNLIPNYIPIDEYLGVDSDNKRYVRELIFKVENPDL